MWMGEGQWVRDQTLVLENVHDCREHKFVHTIQIHFQLRLKSNISDDAMQLHIQASCVET